jgi:hypothetical protein
MGLIEHPTVDNPGQDAIHDSHQAVFVANPVHLPAEQLGEQTRCDDVVEVAVQPESGWMICSIVSTSSTDAWRTTMISPLASVIALGG